MIQYPEVELCGLLSGLWSRLDIANSAALSNHETLVFGRRSEWGLNMNATILWIIAAVIAVIGIIVLIGGSVVWGVILLIVAAAVGPGGYSIFQRRS